MVSLPCFDVAVVFVVVFVDVFVVVFVVFALVVSTSGTSVTSGVFVVLDTNNGCPKKNYN